MTVIDAVGITAIGIVYVVCAHSSILSVFVYIYTVKVYVPGSAGVVIPVTMISAWLAKASCLKLFPVTELKVTIRTPWFSVQVSV